jgi:hypothetical protein
MQKTNDRYQLSRAAGTTLQFKSTGIRLFDVVLRKLRGTRRA